MQYFYCMINTNIYKELISMKKRITFTFEEDLIERLKRVSKKTMIPQSRLVETTLKEILDRYEKEPE